MVSRVKAFIENNVAIMVVAFVALLCFMFLISGTKSENGSITLDGKDAKIEEYTERFIEDANSALYRLMNEDKPSESADTYNITDAEGQGAYTTLDQVIARRKPDGFTDDGKGLQCSKYTGYLATGKMEYSSAHPDYGPVHGKNMAKWLVDNFGWKYIDTPVYGAIGSGGFNTTYGHTAMFLYFTGTNTAMVNDANYVPLTVATHNMDISDWVWVVPGDYEPTPTPEPTPEPDPVSTCDVWYVKRGDTMSGIMKICEGKVDWSRMMDYASTWMSTKVKPGQSVFEGWHVGSGVGLYAGDIIERIK